MSVSKPADELAAFSVEPSRIVSASADEDSMLIVHRNDLGLEFGLVIEFDAPGVTAMVDYLTELGIKIDRDVVIEQFGR
jgi:hypothetical protein